MEHKGYKHEVTFLKGKKKTPSELMPRVHRVISLLKRWLLGTHQGAVSHKHLDYYLTSSRSERMNLNRISTEDFQDFLCVPLCPLGWMK